MNMLTAKRNERRQDGPLRLLHVGVNAHGRELALLQEVVELNRALVLRDENDHLIELERIQEIGELAIFLLLSQLHVVLDEAVQRELRVAVDVHLEGLRRRNWTQ